MRPQPRIIIPGHGESSTQLDEAVQLARDHIAYVRDVMERGVDEFAAFHTEYESK